MARYKHRSKAEWRNLVEQQASSGLNGVAFCAQRELSRKTFYRHRKALEEKATKEATGQFLKVQPKSVQMMPMQSVVVLHYRDSRLQLPAGSDPTWVAELMKALS